MIHIENYRVAGPNAFEAPEMLVFQDIIDHNIRSRRGLVDGFVLDDQKPYWIYAAQNDNRHVAIASQTDEGAIERAHYIPLAAGEEGSTAVTPDGKPIHANPFADRTR